MNSDTAPRIRRRTPAPWFALALVAVASPSLFADSVVVFNEIMYHPADREAQLEWVELHSQMAVPVDLSGWSIAGGIQFAFPANTVIPGGGYLVVALSPTDLQASTGLTNLVGPFTGRLSNNGDSLELLNNNSRLMDTVSYGIDGDWPVGPDGAGVSLAKRDEDIASGPSRNWTVSAQVGGTPGQRNFPAASFELRSSAPLQIASAWKYHSVASSPGPDWNQASVDDEGWSSGSGLFRTGTATPPHGDPEALPSVFSTGMDASGNVLAPGTADPHYLLTKSAHTTPTPPPLPATVIQNHPAWLANDANSSWIGVLNPGSANVAAGAYNYRTTFTLDGYDRSTAVLRLTVGADNRLTDVLLNGVSLGFSYAGFSTLSSEFVLASGFAAGTNTLDFLTANDSDSANPAGFRVRLTGMARRQFSIGTSLPAGQTNLYLRTRFTLDGAPRHTALEFNTIVADGAVFYLNGLEALRLNLPPGPVTESTRAVSNVVNPPYLGPFVLPTTSLVAGTNVLAVEVHTGPDLTPGLLFGADLSITTTNILVPAPISLALNEVSSTTNTEFWVELVNHGDTALDLDGCTVSRMGDAADNECVLASQILAPGALLPLTEASLGFRPDPGDRLVVYSPEHASVLDALVIKRGPRGRWPDATGRWWFPTPLTPGESNQFRFHDEIVINEILYHAPGIPAASEVIGTNLIVPITGSWRYHHLGEDLGTTWREPSFDDRAWPEGAALFYSTTSTLPAPKNTALSLTNPSGTRIITWYFRTPFLFQGTSSMAELTLHPIVDDGAVYYLNGVEIYRQNMQDGTPGYATLARASVATPTYTGPFLVQVTNLLSGTNLLAVEVHQFTTNPIAADMAFGLEVSMAGQLTPATPAHASPESWVELFNRSAAAVDLTGWRLAHDLDFTFPSGTILPAGGFVVVAKDVEFLRSACPGLEALGPFDGKLRRDTCHLLLLDPAGNPADEVRYYDRKPWPEYADGGGSSLELRDPWADNARPESWQASTEAARSSWTQYSYRGVAANRQGPTLWREFVLGLLDAGECLIDDLSVLENPAGTPVSMLQNGTFESGLTAWRALGDHSRSRVETDPDNAANHVLHLIATGPTEHIHNHLETTLANGRAVTDGREYQISFRAKWLAGNPRLNTRLYFNRLARTTELTRPARHGTPGAPNSTLIANLGPTFADFAHSPVVPKSTDPVAVRINASDPQEIRTIAVRWSVNSGSWQTTFMVPDGSGADPAYGHYTAVLPRQAAGTLVQMYIEATDGAGAVSTYPAGGSDSGAFYKVDGGGGLMTALHRIRLLMTPDHADLLHASTNVMSLERMPLTVVYDERQVFYDVGVHLQSSERGRDASSRVGFTVQFNADPLFRGVQNNFTIDRSGGYSGRGGRHDEILLWHAVNHAGGILGLDCDLIQVFAPRAQENSTGLLRMSAFDGDYFDNQFANGADGYLHTLELIYYPTTTATGDPQAPKLPQPDDVIGYEIQNRGDDPEEYRWIFLQENHADEDQYDHVVALNQAFSLTGTALETRINALMDTDQFLRTLAFKAFTGDVDTYTYGYPHNWKFYFRPSDGRALGVLWDMDFSYYQSTDSGFPGSASANTYRITALPNNHRRFCNHLLDILTTTVNASYLRPWATRYAGLVGEDWSSAVTYLQQRADYIRNTLPLTTAFAVTSNGGNDFSTTTSSVTLVGTAPMTVKDILINNVPYPITWTSLTAWKLAVPLPDRTNRLNIQGMDSRGNLLSNASDSITVTNQGLPALRPVLINEWMADNSDPGGFIDVVQDRFPDWFELYNPNTSAVDLGGCFLTDTLSEPTKWTIPTGTTLPASGFLLVWADRRPDLNGSGSPGLHADFQLNNGGEAIGLYAPNGTPQHTVVFGPQIQNVSQGFYPDGNTNALYSMPHWTPAAPNTLGAPPPPWIGPVAVRPNGQVFFTFSATPDRTYRVDWTLDPASQGWIPLLTTRASATTVDVADAAHGVAQRFYRVVLVP